MITVTERSKDGSPPDVVSRVILHALTAKRPKVRYVVGQHANRMTTIARFAPARQMDRVITRFLALR